MKIILSNYSSSSLELTFSNQKLFITSYSVNHDDLCTINNLNDEIKQAIFLFFIRKDPRHHRL